MVSVWVAIISAAATLIGTIVTVLISRNQTIAALDKQSELSDAKIQAQINVIDTKIETLSARVNAHNNLIERMYHVEAAVTELQHNAGRGQG